MTSKGGHRGPVLSLPSRYMTYSGIRARIDKLHGNIGRGSYALVQCATCKIVTGLLPMLSILLEQREAKGASAAEA